MTDSLNANAFLVTPISPNDRPWIVPFLHEHWGSTKIVSRGRVHEADRLPGYTTRQGKRNVGLATYCIENGECELVSLNSLVEGIGIGSALVVAVVDAARQHACRRLWLITTNDNIAALRFYQKRNLVLAALHRNALDASRRLKPQIPLIGNDGIPLRDEIEFEMML